MGVHTRTSFMQINRSYWLANDFILDVVSSVCPHCGMESTRIYLQAVLTFAIIALKNYARHTNNCSRKNVTKKENKTTLSEDIG